jgi:hypothetical protein
LYVMTIGYLWWLIGVFFPILVCCTKGNLAILVCSYPVASRFADIHKAFHSYLKPWDFGRKWTKTQLVFCVADDLRWTYVLNKLWRFLAHFSSLWNRLLSIKSCFASGKGF